MDSREGKDRADQVDRIGTYEKFFQEAEDLMKKTSLTSEETTALEEMVRSLEEYYESGLWLLDYESDEAGMLPAELLRGVLSEDGLYDLLERYRDLNPDSEAESYVP